MKKNISIAILALISILSLSYAYVKRGEAEIARVQAAEAVKMADAHRLEAMQQKKIAEEQHMLARENEKIAQHAMQRLNDALLKARE